ncbi:hypothetical protein [Microcystis phage vB_MweS-yong2]|nr:hypothetical protein [Microcystis phage vB_MweS-yong2]
MKNRLSDLNNHLFAQMERLSEEGLSPEKVAQEAERGAAIVAVADQIIRNAELQLKAVALLAEHGERAGQFLKPMLEGPRAAPPADVRQEARP